MGEKTELSKVRQVQVDGQAFLLADVDASLDDVEQSSGLPGLVKEGLHLGTNWHHRNEYTVEKSLLSPSLAQQWVASLLAVGAALEFEDGATASVADLLSRRGTRGKMKALLIPMDEAALGAEAHVGLTPGDTPIVSSTVGLVLEAGKVAALRIALAGAYKESVRLSAVAAAYLGKVFSEDLIAQVADAVEEESTPKADYRGSVEYRKRMAGVLTRRALETCLKGAVK